MLDWPVEWFDEIDSTNEEARRRVSSGRFNDTWIVSRSQSIGRGRLGRKWVSPPGNLYTTALFHFDGTLRDASKLPFAVSLAVSDVFLAFAPDQKIELKWPNDVRTGRAKLSGILIEAGSLERNCWVAAGIGMNISTAPESVGQTASCLSLLRGDDLITPDAALEELRACFSKRLSQLNQGFDGVRADWLGRAEGIGTKMSVSRGSETIEGVFETLGPDGELLLRSVDGNLTTITAGDVELITERVV